MGYEYSRRPILTRGFRHLMAPTNVTSTATRLTAPGAHAINAPASDKTYQLGNPVRGAEAVIMIDTSSTKVVTIATKSSACTFYGSTCNDIAVSTGQACAVLELVGLSTSKWAWSITSKSTTAKCTLAASTR